MRSFYLFSFLVISLLVLTGFSVPTEDDRQEALKLLYTVANGQEETFVRTSNYQDVKPRWVNGYLPSAEAYSTLQGKGYVVRVTKVIEGKVWVIERHFGPDTDVESSTRNYWTCTNCAEV